jgi:hypothetical protein
MMERPFIASSMCSVPSTSTTITRGIAKCSFAVLAHPEPVPESQSKIPRLNEILGIFAPAAAVHQLTSQPADVALEPEGQPIYVPTLTRK